MDLSKTGSCPAPKGFVSAKCFRVENGWGPRKKNPFQISFKMFVSSMLFPDDISTRKYFDRMLLNRFSDSLNLTKSFDGAAYLLKLVRGPMH